MWIGIDDAEILIEDLLFEEERVDLRVSFGEGAKDTLEDCLLYTSDAADE